MQIKSNFYFYSTFQKKEMQLKMLHRIKWIKSRNKYKKKVYVYIWVCTYMSVYIYI